MKKLTTDEIADKRAKKRVHEPLPVTVLVDSVRSLYNVGSIFRTSDGAGIRHLVLSGYTPRPPRKEIEKTALGATDSVAWSFTDDPVQTLTTLKQDGFRLCCLEQTDRSLPYYSVNRNDFPLCLIIGNEVKGVSASLINKCDFAIEVPMFGNKHSLNVAVAYGIAIFGLSQIWRNGTLY